MGKQVQCILRLLDKNNSYTEICEWLLSHKLVTEVDVKSKVRLQEKAEYIHEVLKKAEKDEFFILLDFEWTVLPLELIRITCVTEQEKKEFTYGY